MKNHCPTMENPEILRSLGNHDLHRRLPSGFALVVSLTMMVLLTVIAVGLLSLSAITLRTTQQTSAQAEAQANAKLALMIAIGELQTVAGPDRRITARGASLANHPALSATVSPASPQAFWVGAASSDSDELIGSLPKPVVWLVSGLNPQASASDQITGSQFIGEQVSMYGASSINLSLTGGRPITAGLVPVADQQSGDIRGSYAYFVDDEGMKAQLVTSHPNLVNSNSEPISTVVPVSYDLSILNGMESFENVPFEDYFKLLSINSLPLMGSQGSQIARDKRMAYTTRSLGVLSDAKRGGLKKDLTIAFEKHTTSSTSKNGGRYPNMPSFPVFDEVFAKTSDSEWGDYLLLDESKRGEFAEQGYIHWGMLRDYYNLKRYIRRENGQDCLAPIVVSRHNMNGSLSGAPYARGIIPPHRMGGSGPGESFNRHEEMPYGDFQVVPNLDNDSSIEFIEYYKHSPIVPILGQLQYNCWVEKGEADPNVGPIDTDATDPEAIVVHTQMFTSHYNPYNIGMFMAGDRRTKSMTLRYMPSPKFRFRESDVTIIRPNNQHAVGRSGGAWNVEGVASRNRDRRYTVNSVELVEPGRAMFTAFENDFEVVGNNHIDMIYSTNVRDVITESAQRKYNVVGELPPTLDWSIRFGDNGMFAHGVSHRSPGSTEWTASQFIWSAFSRDSFFDFDDLDDSTYNDNSRLSFNMRLRSTREEGVDSIRPLIDGNIRSIFLNRRWDQPLYPGLDHDEHMLTLYEAANNVFEFDSYDPNLERIPQMQTQSDGRGFAFLGADNTPPFGFDRVILFDVPRQDLVSLGQLQHANVGRFSYEPSYIIGNSYANPRIPLDQWKASHTDSTPHNSGRTQQIQGPYDIYDASYLVNEALWDSYTFTTIPQVADNYNDPDESEPSEELFSDLLARNAFLPNPRHIPYQPSGSRFDMETLQADEAVHYNAGHLLVDGAFNVNSTSVDAWEAFLSGTHGLPYQKLDTNGTVVGFENVDDDLVRFPRVQSVFGEEMKSNSLDENYWIGFRALEQSEVRELAEAMVEEIRARGPFLSMADFVNRKLESGDHGHMGALQAALDQTINANVRSDFTLNANHPRLPPNAKQSAGFPGQLLQGDILQALAPSMSVRSDTFTIRAYGESIDPRSGEVLARAWCEATIQRVPDPVLHSSSEALLDELAQPTNPFGRKFHMTSFRWLNANEI